MTDWHDTWRLFHPEGNECTWCKKIPLLLDDYSDKLNVFDKNIDYNIHFLASTGHRGCSVLVKFAEIKGGPGYWNFSNSLLKDVPINR